MTLDFPMLKKDNEILSPTNVQDFEFPSVLSSVKDSSAEPEVKRPEIVLPPSQAQPESSTTSVPKESSPKRAGLTTPLSKRLSRRLSGAKLNVPTPLDVEHTSSFPNVRSGRDPNLSNPPRPKRNLLRTLRRWVPGTTIELPTIGARLVGDTSVLEVPPKHRPKDLPLLPPPSEKHASRITLVLDLEETLVHVTQLEKYSEGTDFSFTLKVGGKMEKFYVRKRPGVDEFLRAVAGWYEVVVFSGSGYAYVEEIMNGLDPNGYVTHRLYKEHCTLFSTYIVKDLSLLGRDLRRVIIMDNSESCYAFQPENAIRIPTWISREDDRELLRRLPILEKSQFLRDVRNSHVEVEDVLK